MYSPAHYREESTDLILDVIRRYDFATLITVGTDGPFVSHLPLLLEVDNDRKTLIGHCARANPQWKHFAEGQTVTAIFNGPHAYISPAWYEPQIDNVPTWNYVAVHAKGKAQIIEEPKETYETLRKIVTHFEGKYKTGWQLPTESNRELEGLARAIVAFRIEIESLQGKFKLSQKQDTLDRENVIEQLANFGANAQEVAEFMKS